MDSDKIHFSCLINMESPEAVINEVMTIINIMHPDFDFKQTYKAFKDIVRLFNGEYPGYRNCNTEYHDLKHTTDTLLSLARLIHGACIERRCFSAKDINLGLISALMHDTGYIQTLDDKAGTGAKYTLVHVKRSIAFMEKYFPKKSLSWKEACKNLILCTAPDLNISKINFGSHELEMMGKLLATSDLVGQMANRTYLEKLLFLFREFSEARITDYGNELELLKKTLRFYDSTLLKLEKEMDNMHEYFRSHFKARWDMDRNLYMEAVCSNIEYLKLILKNHEKDYRTKLKRGGIVKKIRGKSA